MITAYSKTIGDTVKVDALANRGQWFGKTWLVGIGMGFDTHMVIVEGDNEGDVIDSLVDSSLGHLIKTDDLCPKCEINDFDNCTCQFAGNNGERIDSTDIRILERVKVSYFVKKGD